MHYRRIVSILALCCLASPAGRLLAASARPSARGGPVPHSELAAAPIILAQEETDGPEVPADQIEKYAAVYKSMQHDRSLNLEAAAAKQGLTVSQFRQLEAKVERNFAAREHVRKELQDSAGKHH